MSSGFIVCSLFVPRLTLLTCWLILGLPSNSTPLVVDALMVFFLPRVLIAWWAAALVGVVVAVAITVEATR